MGYAARTATVCSLPWGAQFQLQPCVLEWVLRKGADEMWKQADKVNTFEVEHGWKEEQFDFILQFLRTILMKRKHSQWYVNKSTDECRWCILNIHFNVLSKLPPNTRSFHTGHTFSAQKANSQAQRH